MNDKRREPLCKVFEKWPFAKDWLLGYNFPYDSLLSLEECVCRTPEEYFRDIDREPEAFLLAFENYIADMEALFGTNVEQVEMVSILPGRDKDGRPEEYERIDWHRGEVIAVVGATGSGKSRLLADVEWCADADTPTGRRILVNDHPAQRQGIGGKRRMVAQLSQNMNFVMDTSVREFLRLHARCWQQDDVEGVVSRVLEMANRLAGEGFCADTHLTGLSGGQSRALMIADCALLSDAPVVLIDEIENAGINRREALQLLSGENKIVLMATHDPVLALLADQRLVVKNGGIGKVLSRNEKECAALAEAEAMDMRLMRMREALRSGRRLSHMLEME